MTPATLPVAELRAKAAAYNPRKISDHDLDALRRSLRFFGPVQPIVVNERTGRIVGGHQRVKAAEAEGIEALPVVYVSLDEPSEKQLNLALNRVSGEFDRDRLEELVRDLEASGADLGLTGFTDKELSELVSDTPDADREMDGETDGGYQSQYGVIVMCSNEAEQERVYQALRAEGYDCKVVVT